MSRLLVRRRVEAAYRALRQAAFSAAPTQAQAFAKLRADLPPAVVAVDVGANVGRWTIGLLARFPQARVLMVEAQPELMPQLGAIAERNPAVHAVNAVLAADASTRTLYVCHGDRHRSGTSLRRELTGNQLEERGVTTTTLDAVTAAAGFERVDLIKLDTQGSELEILEGAPDALAAASVVQLELSVVPYNEGAPLLAEAVAYMSDRGFAVRDVFDLMYLPGTDVLAQFNCVFSRRLDGTTR